MRSNNFNLIASIYDRLAKIVFGKSLIESQIYFLSTIKEMDSILIIGGGTGKLLEHIPKCNQVHFVDLSEQMIVRAKKRDCIASVEFIQTDFLTHDFKSTYDVIICPFFLDCFDKENLKKSLRRIKSLLNPEGNLIISDFQKTKKNRLLLQLMHLFFRICASLQSKNIENIHEEALLVGFKVHNEKIFYRKMIFSRLYGNL